MKGSAYRGVPTPVCWRMLLRPKTGALSGPGTSGGGSVQMRPTPPSGSRLSSTGPLSDDRSVALRDAGQSRGWAMAASAQIPVALTDRSPQNFTKTLPKLYRISPNFNFLPRALHARMTKDDLK